MSLKGGPRFQREMSLKVAKLGSWRHDRDPTYRWTSDLGAGPRLRRWQRADVPSAHQWMSDTLRRFNYRHGTRADQGLLRRYLAKVTGLSRAQVTRAIMPFCTEGDMTDRRLGPAKPFARRYTDAAVRLLAAVDERHGTLSGPATRRLCERLYHRFGDTRFER